MTVPSIPRSKPSKRRRRRVRTRALVLLAVAASLLLFIGRGTAQLLAQVSCSNKQVVLTVAVSPDIAPAIERIANYFNRQRHQADGRCVPCRSTPSLPRWPPGRSTASAPPP